MSFDTIVVLTREALLLMLLVCAPPLAASMGVGLMMGVVQTVTQLQETTLSVVPKLCAAVLALALAGPWMGRELARFTATLLEAIAEVGT